MQLFGVFRAHGDWLVSDKLLGGAGYGFFGKAITAHLRVCLWRAIKYDFSVLSRNS